MKRQARSIGSTHGHFQSRNQPQNMKATMKPQLLVRLSQQKIIPDAVCGERHSHGDCGAADGVCYFTLWHACAGRMAACQAGRVKRLPAGLHHGLSSGHGGQKMQKTAADPSRRLSYLDKILIYSSAIAYCTIMGSSYSARMDLFSSSVLSCSISSAVSSKSKMSRFCFMRSLCTLLGITTMPR